MIRSHFRPVERDKQQETGLPAPKRSRFGFAQAGRGTFIGY
jgi:hypothetical protein